MGAPAANGLEADSPTIMSNWRYSGVIEPLYSNSRSQARYIERNIGSTYISSRVRGAYLSRSPKRKREVMPVGPEGLATHQEALPLPYLVGKRQVALRWIAPGGSLVAVQAQTESTGKKGGDKGKGSGGEGFKTYDYFGTLAGAICWGPADTLHAILIDGEPVYEGTSNRSGDSVDLTSVIDAKWLTTAGYLKLYWGTATQTADSVLSFKGHPGYRGSCYLVAVNLLFGRERTTAPNIEVIVSRLPVCSTALCASADNVLDDGCVNPVAALGELFTSRHGLGWDAARLDATSWAAAGAYCAADADRKLRTFCAPLFTSHVSMAQAASELLELFDAALYWTATGTLGIRLLEIGTNPGSLATIDASMLVEPAQIQAGGAGDVPTGVLVSYVDRARKWKEADEKVDNLVALRWRGEDDRAELERPHVTRQSQAHRIGIETLRRRSKPPVTIQVSVRRELAAGYGAGQKILCDVDPEPGGTALAQLCLITSRSDGRDGVARMDLEADTMVEATPYAPAWTPESPQAAECASIANAVAIPLPPGSAGEVSIAILATRPQADAIGFTVYYATSSGGTFAELGNQTGFACRMTMDADVDDDDTTVRLTLTDGVSGPDAYLAGRTPGTDIEARLDNLLLVIVDLDADSRVTITDGAPLMEFCSIVSRSAVDSDTHDYTVLRGRRNLKPRAWDKDDVTCYIVPAANLAGWTHYNLAGLVGSSSAAWLRLKAYSAFAEDDASPLPEISAKIPGDYALWPSVGWTTPSGSAANTDSSGNITLAGSISDADGNCIGYKLHSRRADDGSGYTEHENQSFAAAGAVSFSKALTFTQHATLYRTYVVTIEAWDDNGHVTTSSRNVVAPPTGTASTPAPPTFAPASGYDGEAPLTVTVYAASPATQIHYAVADIGSSAPSSYSTHSGLTLDLTVVGYRRVWGRASDGSSHSDWVFGDYTTYMAPGGGPYED